MFTKCVLVIILLLNILIAQNKNIHKYKASEEFPYGRINPEAPKQLADFAPMIGECDCVSQNRNPDGTWQDTVKMVWTFEYIMNGLAVQDKTYKGNKTYSGSIRMFNADSSKWYVHYYSSTFAAPKLSVWAGNKIDDKIILSMPQKAPTGIDGFSRLTFYDISEKGFRWIGEWHDPLEKVIYPFWKIDCKKRTGKD